MRFSERGITPIGYAAFAVALGVTAGLIIRRTLPAMVTTLIGFVFTRLAMAHWIRPNLITPAHLVIPLGAAHLGFGSDNGGPLTLQPTPPNMGDAWVYSTQIVNNAGRPLSLMLPTKYAQTWRMDLFFRLSHPVRADAGSPLDRPPAFIRRSAIVSPKSGGPSTRSSRTSQPGITGLCNGSNYRSSSLRPLHWVRSQSGGSGTGCHDPSRLWPAL